MTFDPETAAARIEAELGLLGLLDHLTRPDVQNLHVNPSGLAFVSSGKERSEPFGPFEASRIHAFLQATATVLGRDIDPPLDFEATLPFLGLRMTALLPDLVTAPTVTFRIPSLRTLTLDDLHANGTIRQKALDLLRLHLEAKTNILISGPQNTGKTTLLRALLYALVEEDPFLRIVVLEKGAREMDLPDSNLVSMLANAEHSLTLLLERSLRLGADRHVLGEARGAEALTLLQACNTGHPGVLTTLHANSGLDALHRFDTLVQHARVPSQMPAICEAFGLVAHLAWSQSHRVLSTLHRVEGIDPDGTPRLREIYPAT